MITQETITKLIGFDGAGLPVVSVYAGSDLAPAARGDLRAQVASLLSDIRPLTEGESLGRDARMSLRRDAERIEAAVEAASGRRNPGPVAYFSCSARDFFEEVALPRGVGNRVVVDETPWIRSALAVLDEYPRTGAVLVDKGGARMWELYAGDMREVDHFRDPTLRRTAHLPKFNEYNVRNRMDEMSKRHYRRVAAELERVFRRDGLDLLVVGGQEHEVPTFTEFLPHHLRERLVGTFTLGPGNATAEDVQRRIREVVEGHERREHERLVEAVLEAAVEQRPAALGLEPCLWGASVGAVDTLLVQAGRTVPGVVCTRSDWLGREGGTCPLCGSVTRTTPDVVNELVQAVIDSGGAVKHVEGESRLAEHVAVALLRYPLPPAPQPQPQPQP